MSKQSPRPLVSKGGRRRAPGEQAPASGRYRCVLGALRWQNRPSRKSPPAHTDFGKRRACLRIGMMSSGTRPSRNSSTKTNQILGRPQTLVTDRACLSPFGSRGGSSSLDGLHFGHGMPAPPHWQACGPSHGWSGWFSQTQPVSSQQKHFICPTWGSAAQVARPYDTLTACA
jgi:hypothetical protein